MKKLFIPQSFTIPKPVSEIGDHRTPEGKARIQKWVDQEQKRFLNSIIERSREQGTPANWEYFHNEIELVGDVFLLTLVFQREAQVVIW
jgi:hypothetical protein